MNGHDFDVEATGLDLREVQDVVDDRRAATRPSGGWSRRSRAARRQVGLEREFGHAQHAVHRRADLVAHVGQELALGRGWRPRRGPWRRAVRAVRSATVCSRPSRWRWTSPYSEPISRSMSLKAVTSTPTSSARADGRQGDVEATRSTDFRGRFRQLLQRRDDGPLQECAQAPGQRERHHEDGAEDDQHPLQPRIEHAQVGHHEQTSDAAALIADVAGHTEGPASKTVPGRGAVLGSTTAADVRCIATRTPVGAIEDGAEHVGAGRRATRASPGRHQRRRRSKRRRCWWRPAGWSPRARWPAAGGPSACRRPQGRPRSGPGHRRWTQ